MDFFLSYCREDDNGQLVRDFFGDLCHEVFRRTNTESEVNSVGFIDQRMPIGVNWDARTLQVLRTCRVFVPLFSPRYFISEYCGKEWWAAMQRMRPAAGEITGIVPILWESPDYYKRVMPDSLRLLQRTNERLGEDYRRYGIRPLVQRKNHPGVNYQTLLYELGSIIIEAAEADRLADFEGNLSFTSAVNAFDAPLLQEAQASPTGVEPADSAHVNLVVVAATANEMVGARATTSQYGSYAEDWKPYLADDRPLVRHAMAVAINNSLTPHICDADANLRKMIDEAEAHNHIVLVLLDPWAMKLAKYQNIVKEYDHDGRYITGALVPWPSDEETASVENDLVEKVKNGLKNRLLSQSPSCRLYSRDAEEFVAHLSEVILTIQTWILGHKKVPRPATGASRIPQPTLSTSAGSSALGGRP
jgi:FxsC-like protein